MRSAPGALATPVLTCTGRHHPLGRRNRAAPAAFPPCRGALTLRGGGPLQPPLGSGARTNTASASLHTGDPCGAATPRCRAPVGAAGQREGHQPFERTALWPRRLDQRPAPVGSWASAAHPQRPHTLPPAPLPSHPRRSRRLFAGPPRLRAAPIAS
ncbi:MAG: hypothetical protein J3K34DRAFT_420542 [Monoraphidium minutum]|nr:MAG: hypothetical protein J3K34DRAFT_420542 [Monoraphidium minutum]